MAATVNLNDDACLEGNAEKYSSRYSQIDKKVRFTEKRCIFSVRRSRAAMERWASLWPILYRADAAPKLL